MKQSIISIIFVFVFSLVSAQNGFDAIDLVPTYERYAELPREIAYVHLNKSVYIKGENIGLNAYVMDKASLLPSVETTNLYCTISDASDKLIKEKMFLVTNGTARGDFEIDSLFTSGEYTLRAYTNWMNNFKEPNFFVQKIKVIDPEADNPPGRTAMDISIDAQFLPEGGHIIANARNIMGAAIKDSLGFGIPNAEGDLVDIDGKVITSFATDRFGIGKFAFEPKANTSYAVKVRFNGREREFPLGKIADFGIVMELQSGEEGIALTFRTNTRTLPALKDRYYTLGIHNGHKMTLVDLEFNGRTEVTKTLSRESLFPGMNILTLFDQKNNPLLERQFFNHKGISFAKVGAPTARREKDSIWISLPYRDIDTTKLSNISISVLPQGTRSYAHHHNLPSYVLLRPYLKGAIEGAQYYFNDIGDEKKRDLDNLLLTQGWSSYDWDTVFFLPPDYDHDFENGISYTANSNNTNGGQFLVYPNANSPSELIALEPGENSFERNGFFPLGNEKIKIGELKPNGKVLKSTLYLQFSPSEVPELEIPGKALGQRQRHILNASEDKALDLSGFKKIEQLDEVVLTKKVEDPEIERIRNSTLGRVEFFDEKKRRSYQYFANYISQRGFQVDEGPNSRQTGPNGALRRTTNGLEIDGRDFDEFRIFNLNAPTEKNIPLIYLDGILLTDLGRLKNLRLDNVYYIEVNKAGVGNGIRGGGGVIKIVRDHTKAYDDIEYEDTYKAYDIPMNFNAPKRFYVPKYSSFDTNFFREYGTIDWFPNLRPGPDGNVEIRILDTGVPMVDLYIDGILNNGTFVSETKTIEVNISDRN